MIVIFIMLPLFACSLFEGQTIYEDPEYVDFSAEETAIPEVQIPVEETVEDTFFEEGGIKLYYDHQLILDIEPLTESIPSSTGDEAYSVAHPAYVHFDLSMEQAHVYIAPVKEYESIADFAPDIIADLQRINEGMSNFDDCIPELPLNEFFHTCDHQQFVANAKQLNFQNGAGSRFVTVYGIQDMAPVGNNSLTYLFQGLTNDNKYYLKVIVRVSHDQLPQVGEIPSEVYAATDYSIVDQYFQTFEDTLNQNEADYLPALDWVDSFIQSLRVE